MLGVLTSKMFMHTLTLGLLASKMFVWYLERIEVLILLWKGILSPKPDQQVYYMYFIFDIWDVIYFLSDVGDIDIYHLVIIIWDDTIVRELGIGCRYIWMDIYAGETSKKTTMNLYMNTDMIFGYLWYYV